MFIHSAADVQTDRIGIGTRIWQYSVVLPGATIGRNCNINAHCLVEGGAIIGNNVTLKCGVYVWNCITIDDDVFIGPNATFINDLNVRSQRYPEIRPKTYIKKGASIGANVTILGGITIGEYAMIGAGSLVTKDVPANALWYGHPATMRGYVCMCGVKLGENMQCAECGNTYERPDNGSLILCK